MTHPKLVKALLKNPEEIKSDLTSSDCNLLHIALGLSGEVGEIIDTIKKSTIYYQPLDRENIKEELGDLEFYMEALRQELILTREECIESNIEKLQKRYPDGEYSHTHAKQRLDKLEDWTIDEPHYIEADREGGCMAQGTPATWRVFASHKTKRESHLGIGNTKEEALENLRLKLK